MVVEFHEIKYEMNYHKSCMYIIYSCCFSRSVMSDLLQPHGHSPSGSSVHGISQAGTLEWAAIPFSNIIYVFVCLSVVYDSLRPRTVAHQAPQSMGFSRQQYWSGLPCPPPRNLPNPGIKLGSPALQADSFPFELPESNIIYIYK